jgi:hypothetical protein
MHTNPAVRFCKRRHCSVKNFFRLAIILSLPFIMAGEAAGQYGGGGGTSGGGSGSGNGTYVPPKGGYSSAAGAAVGEEAAPARGASPQFSVRSAFCGLVTNKMNCVIRASCPERISVTSNSN